MSLEWRDLAQQLLSAFDYTRTRELYHIDIKPDNIFYIQKRYMLADFGLCDPKAHDESAQGLAHTLIVALGRNLREERIATHPDAPFAKPLSQLKAGRRVAAGLMELWKALELNFKPYDTRSEDFFARLETNQRPSWMPAPVTRVVEPAIKRKDPAIQQNYDNFDSQQTYDHFDSKRAPPAKRRPHQIGL